MINANAMNIGSSAGEDNTEAEEEIEKLWEFIYSKLFNMKVADEKEKVRLNI